MNTAAPTLLQNHLSNQTSSSACAPAIAHLSNTTVVAIKAAQQQLKQPTPAAHAAPLNLSLAVP
jgi:hypothetical protein